MVFSRREHLMRHQSKPCLCTESHNHIPLSKKFESMYAENSNRFKSSRRKTLCIFNCKQKKSSKCSAHFKLKKIQNEYVLIGCLKHNHEIEAKKQRIPRKTKDDIHRLLTIGMKPVDIKVKKLLFGN